MDYNVSVNQNKIVIESTKSNYEVSLSRTGGQGAKGDSITDAYFTEAGNLIFVISNSAGEVVEQIDTGNIVTSLDIDLNDLADVTINLVGAGYTLVYNSATNRWVSRKLLVTDLGDVAITGIADNHILSYDSATNKFKNHKLTTSRLSNVDETALTDGAMLLYNGTASKYVATTQLDNQNTTIIGGSF